mgnify:CR=1 FL=1
MAEIIEEDGKYICPKCGSKRILLNEQCVLQKVTNANSGKLLNPYTLKARMSNREKAFEYDNASVDGVGCWYYECGKCGWTSQPYTE